MVWGNVMKPAAIGAELIALITEHCISMILDGQAPAALQPDILTPYKTAPWKNFTINPAPIPDSLSARTGVRASRPAF